MEFIKNQTDNFDQNMEQFTKKLNKEFDTFIQNFKN